MTGTFSLISSAVEISHRSRRAHLSGPVQAWGWTRFLATPHDKSLLDMLEMTSVGSAKPGIGKRS